MNGHFKMPLTKIRLPISLNKNPIFFQGIATFSTYMYLHTKFYIGTLLNVIGASSCKLIIGRKEGIWLAHSCSSDGVWMILLQLTISGVKAHSITVFVEDRTVELNALVRERKPLSLHRASTTLPLIIHIYYQLPYCCWVNSFARDPTTTIDCRRRLRVAIIEVGAPLSWQVQAAKSSPYPNTYFEDLI